jgi:hypothetical protein
MATISLDRFLWIDVVVAEDETICNVHPHNSTSAAMPPPSCLILSLCRGFRTTPSRCPAEELPVSRAQLSVLQQVGPIAHRLQQRLLPPPLANLGVVAAAEYLRHS